MKNIKMLIFCADKLIQTYTSNIFKLVSCHCFQFRF